MWKQKRNSACEIKTNTGFIQLCELCPARSTQHIVEAWAIICKQHRNWCNVRMAHSSQYERILCNKFIVKMVFVCVKRMDELLYASFKLLIYLWDTMIWHASVDSSFIKRNSSWSGGGGGMDLRTFARKRSIQKLRQTRSVWRRGDDCVCECVSQQYPTEFNYLPVCTMKRTNSSRYYFSFIWFVFVPGAWEWVGSELSGRSERETFRNHSKAQCTMCLAPRVCGICVGRCLHVGRTKFSPVGTPVIFSECHEPCTLSTFRSFIRNLNYFDFPSEKNDKPFMHIAYIYYTAQKVVGKFSIHMKHECMSARWTIQFGELPRNNAPWYYGR